jgi:hypothetical protein
VVEEAATANLEKIDHIVVVMMENRSERFRSPPAPAGNWGGYVKTAAVLITRPG